MKAWIVRSDEGELYFRTHALANEYVTREKREIVNIDNDRIQPKNEGDRRKIKEGE